MPLYHGEGIYEGQPVGQDGQPVMMQNQLSEDQLMAMQSAADSNRKKQMMGSVGLKGALTRTGNASIMTRMSGQTM